MMSPQTTMSRHRNGSGVIVLTSVKAIRSDSHNRHKRIRRIICKQLRAQGIHMMQSGPLWLAVADHELSAMEIERQIIEYSLRSERIGTLTLHGSFGFDDFFNLRRVEDRSATEFVMKSLAVRFAMHLMCIGGMSWPAYANLQRSLPSLLEPTPDRSHLNVAFGGEHV